MQQFLLGLVLAVASIFLILLVLVQRGRGGGLTGALGGPGGQSAFGAKAGDIFTYITIWTVSIWILLCMSALWWVGCQQKASPLNPALGGQAPAATPGLGAIESLGGEDILIEPPAGGVAPGGAAAPIVEPPAGAAETPAAEAPTVESPAAETPAPPNDGEATPPAAP